MTMQGHELKALRKAMDLRQIALAEALGITPQFVGMMERGEKAIEPRTALSVLYLVDHPEARPDGEDRSYNLADLIDICLEQPGLHDGRTWGRWRFSVESMSLDLDSREVIVDRDEDGRNVIERRERYSIPLDEMLTARIVVNWIGQVAGKNWGAVTVGHLVEALDDIFSLQSTYFHGKGFATPDAVIAELRARVAAAVLE